MGSCCPGSEESSTTPTQKGKRPPAKKSFTEPSLIELATETTDELLNKFKDKVSTIIGKGQKFTDPEFLPQASSIFRPEDGDMDERFEDIEWARASELFDDYDIVKDGVDPCDV